MDLEGLFCWDDYPYEHGCICGNDCDPPEDHPVRRFATVDFMGQPALNAHFKPREENA